MCDGPSILFSASKRSVYLQNSDFEAILQLPSVKIEISNMEQSNKFLLNAFDTKAHLISTDESLLSNIVVLQVVDATENEMVTKMTMNSVELNINLPYTHNEEYLLSPGKNFTTECRKEENLAFTYICPGSGYKVLHDCTDFIGTKVSICPQLAPKCKFITIDGTLVDGDGCETREGDGYSTNCKCSVQLEANETNINSFLMVTTALEYNEGVIYSQFYFFSKLKFV